VEYRFFQKNLYTPVEEVHFRSKGVRFDMWWNFIGRYKNLSKITGIPWRVAF